MLKESKTWMGGIEASTKTAVLIVMGGEHQMITISRRHSIRRSMTQSRRINEQAPLQSLARLVKLEVFRISVNIYSHNKKASNNSHSKMQKKVNKANNIDQSECKAFSLPQTSHKKIPSIPSTQLNSNLYIWCLTLTWLPTSKWVC